MKPEELRNSLSTQLDKAAAGETIVIIRGGLRFELRAVFPQIPYLKHPPYAKTTLATIYAQKQAALHSAGTPPKKED